MLLAIVIAVAPVLVVSIREHRLSKGQRPRFPAIRPIEAADKARAADGPVVERQAAIVALEEAAIAVNRLQSREASAEGRQLDGRLDQASDDLHRALVSLNGAGR